MNFAEARSWNPSGNDLGQLRTVLPSQKMIWGLEAGNLFSSRLAFPCPKRPRRLLEGPHFWHQIVMEKNNLISFLVNNEIETSAGRQDFYFRCKEKVKKHPSGRKCQKTQNIRWVEHLCLRKRPLRYSSRPSVCNRNPHWDRALKLGRRCERSRHKTKGSGSLLGNEEMGHLKWWKAKTM